MNDTDYDAWHMPDMDAFDAADEALRDEMDDGDFDVADLVELEGGLLTDGSRKFMHAVDLSPRVAGVKAVRVDGVCVYVDMDHGEQVLYLANELVPVEYL